MAETKHISYQFTTNVRTVNTLIDRSFLDKIAYNLISNAFKYTPSHHDIAVRVRQEDDSVKLIVEDTGIGIPKDKQKELFERFNQSSFSRDSIGIGLHLTNELVRVHHGTIRFEENPHGGSIFIVSIPTSPDVYAANEFMQTDNAVAIEEEENSQSRIDEVYREVSPIPLNEYTILVVEDDSDVRDFLVQELQRYFLVDSANDGAEALEKIGAEKPSLIVTDALMPIMNGFELVRRIRHEKEWADIPVVMLTALNSEADEIKGLKAGAEAYIRKPFSPSVLITRITRLLEQRKNLKITYAKEVVGNVNTPGIVLEEQDFKLKKQLDAWLMIHLSDSQITVDSFAESLGYGRSKFYKKMKQLTGMTPNDYIRTLRMEKAIELMKDDRLTIAEIAYKVGYADQYYFSKAFKKQFGVAPTRYRKGES